MSRVISKFFGCLGLRTLRMKQSGLFSAKVKIRTREHRVWGTRLSLELTRRFAKSGVRWHLEGREMTNRWGISSRVLRNAAKYDIPNRVARHVARRDECCVYCELRFRIGARSRSNLASWEHLDSRAEKHPKVWNIALCCGSCNASRGPKGLAEWFDSAYCRKRRISRQTVAPVIRRYLGRGLRGR